MDIPQFWQLIEKSRVASGGDCKRQAEILIEELLRLPVEEIIDYEHIFDKLDNRADRHDLRDIAGIIYGVGDSGWKDFRGWLIGQGQQVYEKVIANPEFLGDIAEVDTQFDNYAEFLLYVGMKAYREKTGTEIPPIFDDEPIEKGESLWKGVSSAEEFDRRFKEKYPKIWEKFGSQ